MENIFLKYLNTLPIDLYEYRYIIFEYIYGKFIFIKNKNNFRIFFKENYIVKNSIYFNRIFKLNKYIVNIPNYININDIYLKFINNYLLYDGIFYFNYIKNMKYYEFEELIILLDYFDLIKFDRKKILFFYKSTIDISYNINIVDYRNIYISDLINYNNNI